MPSDPAPRDDADELLGLVLAERYRLEEQIGEGGIGRVYRARHLTLGNYVAVKVLLAQYQDRDVLRKRFEREAAALAELSHPNIVRVMDFGVHGGMPYLVMELLEGADLAAMLRRGEITPERGLAILQQTLRALAHAHENDVVHRDMKPHNVFVRPLSDGTDHVQVLDFGLARMRQAGRQGNKPLTRTGTVLGTPAYMSPEQATGERADATADVYSVGVMLYEVLTGRRPFTSDSPSELLKAHILEEPPEPSAVNPNVELSEPLRAALMKALAKSREARFANAREMLDALDALTDPVRVREGAAPTKPEEEIATAHTLEASPAAMRSGGTEAPTSAERPAARRPTAGAAERPSGVRNAIVIGVALVSLAGLGVVGVILGSGDDPDEDATTNTEPPPPPDPGSDELPAGVGADEVPTAPPAEAPADPLAGPLPEPLAELNAKLERGRTLSRRERATLNAYGREHPDDPRSRLILAHHFVDERSLSWAFPLYEEAYGIDPAVRADPEMLPDLLEMVRSNTLHRQATDFVVRVYGAAARGAVERQLQERMRPIEQERLEALAERLR